MPIEKASACAMETNNMSLLTGVVVEFRCLKLYGLDW